MGQKGTISTILGFVGTLGFILSIPRIVARRPTYGPRLQPGELTAGQASQKAADAYWAAEEDAARGKCKKAYKAFAAAEKHRMQAEEREARGDRTGRDLRDEIRNARAELRRCRT